MRAAILFFMIFMGLALSFTARAGALRVSPTSLTFTAPTSAGTLTLRSDGPGPISVQIRPFVWSQTSGADELQATRDVVVSPPMAKLEPGVDYVVRVVRVVKRQIVGEEAYRILIDELPMPEQGQGNVSLLIRYSVPAFFSAPWATRANVKWGLKSDARGTRLSAVNLGDRSFRIANLKARLPQGITHSLREGLVGYVLGQSEMTWRLPQALPTSRGSELSLVGDSSEGSFDDTVAVGNGR
jgi:fimbrial chaperone protein